MINALKEIERICKTKCANTGMVNDLEGEGQKCLITHGAGVKERLIRTAKVWDFDVRITVRDLKENWQTTMKVLLGIARDLTDTKEHKWIVGDIELVEGITTDYALSLSLTVPYHPGD